MAVSKRLRYEVLRRDNHACRYCGRAAPEVRLTVDHVTPSALGGRDDPSNLVTACTDCNSGKSATPPDAALVADVRQDAMRWAAAQAEVIAERERQRDELEETATALVERWDEFRLRSGQPDAAPVPRPGDAVRNVAAFLSAGLAPRFVEYAITTAMAANKVAHDAVWRYMCGICWRELDAIRETTGQRLAANEAPAAMDQESTAAASSSPLDIARWTHAPTDRIREAYRNTLTNLADPSQHLWEDVQTGIVHRAWSTCFTVDHLSLLAYRADVTPYSGAAASALTPEALAAVLCDRCRPDPRGGT